MRENEIEKLLGQFEQIKEDKRESEESKNEQREKQYNRYKNMTNRELEDDEDLFSLFCVRRGIHQTKRQASKHRGEFLEWLRDRKE